MDIVASYPTLLPETRIRKLRTLGRFPAEDGKVGRLLVCNRDTIEHWIASSINAVTTIGRCRVGVPTLDATGVA